MKASTELQEYWKHQISDFLKSGLDRKTYCQQNNLKLHCLDYWRAKLSGRPAALKKADKSPQWVTLQVTDRQPANAGIRLRVGRLEIEVDPGFSRETLADVLQVAASVC
jgi:hypothetical protein